MDKNTDGSIDFQVNGIVYRFEKSNYEDHYRKHPKVKDEKCLQEIESAIRDPDVKTQGPKTSSQFNFYKVMSYSESKGGPRYVRYWKVVVFYNNKNFARIATCFDSSAPNFYVVNNLEKILWKKPNSQI